MISHGFGGPATVQSSKLPPIIVHNRFLKVHILYIFLLKYVYFFGIICYIAGEIKGCSIVKHASSSI